MKAILLVLVLTAQMFAREKQDDRLAGVKSVFVSGNNQAAEKVRDELEKGKSCLALATRQENADAVMDLAVDSNGRAPHSDFGARNSIVSATLTLKSGDLVWSRSERWDDVPFQGSGAKTAGKLLLNKLTIAVGCKGR